MIDNYSQQVKYKEPLLLFHQENGKLRNVSAEGGPGLRARSFPARGLAIGDFNNDGRIDVLIGNNGGAARAAAEQRAARAITGWE